MARHNNTFKDAYNRALKLIEAEGLPESEPELGRVLGVSRTTVRAVMERLVHCGIMERIGRRRRVLRLPIFTDYFSETETDRLSTVIERHFMRRILEGDARAGAQINELELAREIGVGTTSVREFLIRFSRFGLIEKRPNSHWILKGFDEQFALELIDVREMFEVRSALAFVTLPDDHPSWPALERIEAEHAGLARSMDSRYQAFSELDERFHRLIHHASGNRFVIDFYDVIAMIFHYHYQWNKSNERERNAAALVEHLDYIAALRSRSASAVEAACRAHLRSARTTLLQSMRR